TPLNFLISGGRSNVGFGDAIYAALNGHLPRILAAFIGEAAVDLPDKLVTIVAALLIAQGLPAPRATSVPAGLDLGEAFTFVVRSPRWLRQLLPAAIVEAATSEGSKTALGGSIAAGAGLLAAVGSVWGVAVLLIEAAILSQYLQGGFWPALNVAAVIRRLRVNLGLSIVVGVLVV